ncbi:hypothetical protein AX16_003755 [Volvariella volvacea WC 439]|nr:hypothetical protein AX16_003755 [Volvariella volvacea WC 439]
MQQPIFNPFLITRFVLLALIFNACLLGLLFTVWNLHVSSVAQIPLSPTSIFMVFTNSISLICVTLGLVELLFPYAKTSWMMFECVWSAVLSTCQIGSAISWTVSYALISVPARAEPRVHASMALLVQSTWFSGFFLLTFFFTLLITTFIHRRVCAKIWSQSPYRVHWFSTSGLNIAIGHFGGQEKPQRSRDIESATGGVVSAAPAVERAPWAQTGQVRRGIDVPFAPKSTHGLIRPISSTHAHSRSASSFETQTSRFVERFHEPYTMSCQASPLVSEGRSSPFPDRVEDHNLPIPKPKMSEWVRADSL